MNAPGVESLPKCFHRAPQAYDAWQAYLILTGFAGDERDQCWSFGFPASLSFPATEVEGLDVDVVTSRKEARERHSGDGKEAGPNAAFSWPDNQALVQRDRSGEKTATNVPKVRLDVNLPGLLGPGGPLPLHSCEAVFQETREGNNALQDFLDLFHNRLMGLWMRNLSVMCPELGPIKQEEDDLPALCAFALSGMLVGGLRRNPQTIHFPGPPWKAEMELPVDAFSDTAPLWALHPPSAAGLEGLLQKCLSLDARVEQFCGGWRELPADVRSRLGDVNTCLGDTFILGARVFDPCGGVAMHVGNKRKLLLRHRGLAVTDDNEHAIKFSAKISNGRYDYTEMACFTELYLGSEMMSINRGNLQLLAGRSVQVNTYVTNFIKQITTFKRKNNGNANF